MDKRHKQLGMNPGTAANRLVKDLLFKFAVELGHKCFRCGEALARDSFSVEHKVPWLDSEDPLKLFFDLDNIAFSHLTCNSKAARKPHKKYQSHEEFLVAVRPKNAARARAKYTPENRRIKYNTTGH